jgi:hypothetical protein
MAKEAVTKALNDAGLQISDIKQACVGYVYGTYCFYIIIILVLLYFPNRKMDLCKVSPAYTA